MVLNLLSTLALAADVDVGGELRLDLTLDRVDLLAEGGQPTLGTGISRGAIFLGASPTSNTDVFFVADLRSTGATALLADDGSLVAVPPGFEAHLLDARVHRIGTRWAGAAGRMPSLMGLDDFNQSIWTSRSPYFYVPGVRPSQTPMRRQGLVPERVNALRLTVGSSYPRVDAQVAMDGDVPLAELRAYTLVFTSLFLTGSARIQEGVVAWSGAASWTGWRGSILGTGFGEGEDIGAALRLRATFGSNVVTAEATGWKLSSSSPVFGGIGAIERRHSEQLSTGIYWEQSIPADASLAIEHDVGLQLKTWF